MSDTTGQIRAKRLGNTGITEDILTRLADAEGGELAVIATLRYEEVHKKRDGSRKVDLVIHDLEAATTGDADEHIRGVQRALFMNRKLHGTDAQPALIDTAGDAEPSVEDVMAKGVQFTPHDYIKELGDGTACNVCGKPEDAPLHGDLADGLFQEPGEPEDLADDRDLTELPHAASPDPEDESLCFLCDQHVDDEIHTTVTEEVPA